jgi:hypothetical protein
LTGRNVGQTQFPGRAHNSARRKKQSLQVISGRFAKADAETTSGVVSPEADPGANFRKFREEPLLRCRY